MSNFHWKNSAYAWTKVIKNRSHREIYAYWSYSTLTHTHNTVHIEKQQLNRSLRANANWNWKLIRIFILCSSTSMNFAPLKWVSSILNENVCHHLTSASMRVNRSDDIIAMENVPRTIVPRVLMNLNNDNGDDKMWRRNSMEKVTKLWDKFNVFLFVFLHWKLQNWLNFFSFIFR